MESDGGGGRSNMESGLEDLDCRVSQVRTKQLPAFTLKGLRAEPHGNEFQN